jgi:hypothetical protein
MSLMVIVPGRYSVGLIASWNVAVAIFRRMQRVVMGVVM